MAKSHLLPKGSVIIYCLINVKLNTFYFFLPWGFQTGAPDLLEAQMDFNVLIMVEGENENRMIFQLVNYRTSCLNKSKHKSFDEQIDVNLKE